MPIELRRSDVMFAAAEAFGKVGKFFRNVHDTEYAAETVTQVNRSLTDNEESYQGYNGFLPKKFFTTYSDGGGDLTGGSPRGLPLGSGIKVGFGQATLPDVMRDGREFFEERMKHLNETVTNPDALIEMRQHLTVKHLQNQDVVRRMWEAAAKHEAMAALDSLYEWVMSSNLPWSVKIDRIQSRVDAYVSAQLLWPDEAKRIVSQATTAAQYSFAQNGAMDAMREARDPEAGEKWLIENTPFYDSNPDARAGVLTNVRREFTYIMKVDDQKQDRKFSELHIRALSIEEVDAAIAELTIAEFYNGLNKTAWSDRFMGLRARLVLQATAADPAIMAQSAWMKKNEEIVEAQVTMMLEDGIKGADIYQFVEDLYDVTDSQDVHTPRISGPFLRAMRTYIYADQDPAIANAATFINQLDLSPEDELIVTTEFHEWHRKNSGATTEEINSAINNIVKPVEKHNLTQLLKGIFHPAIYDASYLDNLERMTGDIDNDKYRGIASQNMELLDDYGGLLVARAQDLYSDLEITSFFIDYKGDQMGPPGAAHLTTTGNQRYNFILEGNILILRQLVTDEKGETIWWEVIKPTAERLAATERDAQVAFAEAGAPKSIEYGEQDTYNDLIALRVLDTVDQDKLEGYVDILEELGHAGIGPDWKIFLDIQDFIEANTPVNYNDRSLILSSNTNPDNAVSAPAAAMTPPTTRSSLLDEAIAIPEAATVAPSTPPTGPRNTKPPSVLDQLIALRDLVTVDQVKLEGYIATLKGVGQGNRALYAEILTFIKRSQPQPVVQGDTSSYRFDMADVRVG